MNEQVQDLALQNVAPYIDAVDNWSNSFKRPLVPPNLLSNSVINRTEDDGAKLIYAKFLYGEKTGKIISVPFDGSYGNIINDVSDTCLWDFYLDDEKYPNGFKASKSRGGNIRTGRTQKCSSCRGHGRVVCKECGGKVRWTEKSGESYIEKVCSCGDGKQNCKPCDGYGNIESVIVVNNEFRLYETKNSQYTGDVPVDIIKKVTGHKIYEETIEYPESQVRSMIRGGINVSEFDALNDAVLELLHDRIDEELGGKGLKIKEIHKQINDLFNSLPNPGRENILLEKEAIPIRVMIRVEDAPVKQLDYTYKDNDYSIWVFGNENEVWFQSIPSSFNYKVIILLLATLAALGLIIAYLM
jgi:hypothetical protein